MSKEERLCFIVGPIGSAPSETRNHADLLLDFIIKPVMAEFSEFHVKRQDEDSKPGMIDSQIITSLRDADLVIADLSHLNPNAFYEIGIRHMVAKPIIHMQLEEQRIPFDLSLYKTVPFSFLNPATYRSAQDILRNQVREALAPNYEPDNPVTRALGQQHFRQTASSDMKVVADKLDSLSARLAAIEDRSPKTLTGVVSHHFTLVVILQERGHQAYAAFADAMKLALPDVDVQPSGTDRCELSFETTTKGAERIAKLVTRMPLVHQVGPPLLRAAVTFG